MSTALDDSHSRPVKSAKAFWAMVFASNSGPVGFLLAVALASWFDTLFGALGTLVGVPILAAVVCVVARFAWSRDRSDRRLSAIGIAAAVFWLLAACAGIIELLYLFTQSMRGDSM